VEREFRGFARAERREVGDESAPTLVTAEHYDLGLTEYALKGKELDVELRGEAGEVYRRTTTTWQTRTLATGIDGVAVVLPFASAAEIEHVEAGSGPPRTVREEHEYDDYGNETVHRQLGDVALDGDEVVTTTEFAVNAEDWILDRKAHEVVADLAGTPAAERRFYYDGEPFEGLPLGQLARGKLVRIEEWRGEASGGGYRQKERNQIDEWGNVIAKLDPSGYRRDFEHDAESHTFVTREVVHLDGYDLEVSAAYERATGALVSYSDWNGHTTSFVYDALGRLTATIRPGDTAQHPTTAYVYSLGSPLSSVWTKSRVDSGKEATSDQVGYFDGLGRKRQTRTAAEESKWVVTEAVGFNVRGGVHQMVRPFFAAASDYAEADPAALRDLAGYDALGRKVVAVAPDGTKTSVVHLPLAHEEYDEEDNDPSSSHYGTPRLVTKDGLGLTFEMRERGQGVDAITRYEWNPLGKLVRMVDANGHERTFVHDGLGRRTDLTDPDAGHWRYTFDDADNLVERIDSKGQVVRWRYDQVDRPYLEEHVGADGSSTRYAQWHYDTSPSGRALENVKARLAWVESLAGSDYHSYDAQGRLVMTEAVIDDRAYTTRLAYNALNNEVSRTYPDGSVLATRYNARNLVSGLGGIVAHVEYDASGKEARQRYGNTVETSLEYDERERLRAITTTRGSVTLQALGVALDGASNVTSIADGLGRASQTFVYDDLYRLTSASGGYGTLAFAYDSVGKITRRDATQDSKLALGEYGYTGKGPHQVTHAGGEAYAYDENGNLASGRGRTFAYDNRQQLVGATLASGARVELTYDADGTRRIKRLRTPDGHTTTVAFVDRYTESRGGAIVKYVWLNGRRVAEIGPSQPLDRADNAALVRGRVSPATFALAIGLLALVVVRKARRRRCVCVGALLCWLGSSCGDDGASLDRFPNDARIYHFDHLGSTNLLSDAKGQAIYEEVQHPFGTQWLRAGAASAGYRFSGKSYDDELGLYYFGTRYYDPLLARWLSPDRHFIEHENNFVERAQEGDPYSYVRNNPLSLMDPDGTSGDTIPRQVLARYYEGPAIGYLIEKHRGNLPHGISAAIAEHESKMSPTASNPSGARGVYQIMKQYRADYARASHQQLTEADLLNPEKNVKAALAMLNAKYSRFAQRIAHLPDVEKWALIYFTHAEGRARVEQGLNWAAQHGGISWSNVVRAPWRRPGEKAAAGKLGVIHNSFAGMMATAQRAALWENQRPLGLCESASAAECGGRSSAASAGDAPQSGQPQAAGK
jgi:RHS repeat-associated protein